MKNRELTMTSMAAAVAAMGTKADVLVKNAKTYFGDGEFPASSINNTHEVPTGRARLVHAIHSGRDAYHSTNKGKRVPKKLTKKEMRRALNRLLRTQASA